MSITTKVRPPRRTALAEDVAFYNRLVELPGYDPVESKFNPEALRRAFDETMPAHAADDQLTGAYKAGRDRRTRMDAEFHDLMLQARLYVRTHFGPDSSKLYDLGLKRKSDRKPRRRKAATHPAGARPQSVPASTPGAPEIRTAQPAAPASAVVKPAA